MLENKPRLEYDWWLLLLNGTNASQTNLLEYEYLILEAQLDSLGDG